MPKNHAIKLLVTLCSLSSVIAEGATKTEVVCSYAPSQKVPVAALSSLLSGAGAGTLTTLHVSGITLVPHSSGLPIMTGTAGYIAGSMPGAITATQIITAGAVIGGSVVIFELACAPVNHPEKIKMLKAGAKGYSDEALVWLSDAPKHDWKAISSEKYESLKDLFGKYQTLTADVYYEVIGETWYERIYRKSKNAFD